MLIAISTLLTLLPFATAQTSTKCNPTMQSCPADPAFGQTTTTFDFQTSGYEAWTVLGSGDQISQDSNGLHFTITAAGQAPTLVSNGNLLSTIVAKV